MIDLHIHTHYSDGADTLIEVLNKAEKRANILRKYKQWRSKNVRRSRR